MFFDKLQRPQDTSLSEIISDYTFYKMQWYAKRFDSQVKEKIYGQQAFDPDIVSSSLDKQLIFNSLQSRLKQKTEEALQPIAAMVDTLPAFQSEE